jgi:hypothetical protein
MKRKSITVPSLDGYDVEGERRKLREAADRLGIVIPENFYPTLEPGDIIEVYSNPPEYKQLYCNEEFWKHCSYTREQMETIPYPKLFWRSDEFQFKLMKKAEYVTLHEDQAVPWNLELHELVENFHPRKRTFEIQMRYVSPFFDKKSNKREGVVSTLRVNLIFEWPEEVD